MTLAPGRVLSSYDTKTLAPYVYTISLQLSSALAHIHALSLVHDDIKPENVIFSTESDPPVVTLVDFGACIERDHFTSSGTPWYMAPEYFQRIKGSKTDVWALGVTMAWVLGEFPLPETTREEWILPMVWEDAEAKKKMDEWLGLMADVRARLASDLGQIAAQMLEPNPEKRPEADEVVNLLRRIEGKTLPGV